MPMGFHSPTVWSLFSINKLLLLATAHIQCHSLGRAGCCGTLFTTRSRRTLFYQGIFSTHCCIREIVERLQWARKASTAPRVPRRSRPAPARRTESGRRSPSAISSDSQSRSQTAVVGVCVTVLRFPAWGRVRGCRCAAIMPEPQGFMRIPLDSHLWLYETLKSL